MATIGKINPYDDGLEDWGSYVERADQYFTVNEMSNEKKVPAILSLMGPKTYALLKSLHTSKTWRAKLQSHCKKLKDHLNPKPLEIAECFRFYKQNQKEGESVGDSVAGIRKLSTHCNFGEFQENMLRDRLVCGLKSEHIQNKLLAQADLSLTYPLQKLCQWLLQLKLHIMMHQNSMQRLQMCINCHTRQKRHHPRKSCVTDA